jgi:heme/copper-type cytochrome/quinol oxidase subunit 4
MAAEGKMHGIGRDIGIYVCLLVLAGVQFIIAYSHMDVSTMLWSMLMVAVVEGSLAMLFFMHLWSEKPAFLWFVVIFTVAVLLGLQYSWTDSFRMLVGHAPFSNAPM